MISIFPFNNNMGYSWSGVEGKLHIFHQIFLKLFDNCEFYLVFGLFGLQDFYLVIGKREIVLDWLSFLLGRFPRIDEPWENYQKSVTILQHEIQQVKILNTFTHSHLIVEFVGGNLIEWVIDLDLKVCMLAIVVDRIDLGIAVRENLPEGVMIGEMNLEIGLEFDILNKIFKLSLAKLLMHWHLFHLFW